jgi:hypothetical protein
MPEASQKSRRDLVDHWTEIVSALLLAVATVASTWCAYQSALWGGIQTFRLADSFIAGRKAAEQSVRADQQQAIDVGMFIYYVEAVIEDKAKSAEFILKRFRPEMKVALDAWLATKPRENPDAPSSPFVMKEYSLEADREAIKLDAESVQYIELAQEANETSDSYVLLTVLYATVLFFAGIGPKFDSRVLKILVLVFGVLIFIGATIALLYFPVAPLRKFPL